MDNDNNPVLAALLLVGAMAALVALVFLLDQAANIIDAMGGLPIP